MRKTQRRSLHLIGSGAWHEGVDCKEVWWPAFGANAASASDSSHGG